MEGVRRQIGVNAPAGPAAGYTMAPPLQASCWRTRNDQEHVAPGRTDRAASARRRLRAVAAEARRWSGAALRQAERRAAGLRRGPPPAPPVTPPAPLRGAAP